MQSIDMTQLIEEIHRHELNLAKMYAAFARSHPDHSKFWSQLAREESMHAKWIKSLGRHYKEGRLNLSAFKLNPQALKTSIAYIEKQTEESKKGNLSLLNAVSIALDIEKSLIDNKFFEIFDLDGSKHDRIRSGLEKETAMHRRHLEKLSAELSSN